MPTKKDKPLNKPGKGTPREKKAKAEVLTPEVCVPPPPAIALPTPEEALRNVLKFVHENKVETLSELSERTSIPLEMLKGFEADIGLTLVSISQFKETFPVKLAINIQNLSVIIDGITSAGASKDKIVRAEGDAFKLQKYVQSMKILNDMIIAHESYSPASLGNGTSARRTIRVSNITEEVIEIFRRKSSTTESAFS